VDSLQLIGMAKAKEPTTKRPPDNGVMQAVTPRILSNAILMVFYSNARQMLMQPAARKPDNR